MTYLVSKYMHPRSRKPNVLIGYISTIHKSKTTPHFNPQSTLLIPKPSTHDYRFILACLSLRLHHNIIRQKPVRTAYADILLLGTFLIDIATVTYYYHLSRGRTALQPQPPQKQKTHGHCKPKAQNMKLSAAVSFPGHASLAMQSTDSARLGRRYARIRVESGNWKIPPALFEYRPPPPFQELNPILAGGIQRGKQSFITETLLFRSIEFCGSQQRDRGFVLLGALYVLEFQEKNIYVYKGPGWKWNINS
ncbi:hypothetical protein DFH27DRAFT_523365 [Peziza echinospora]|nr:hypothetical protein DFH27DRAFT_523365 [Peziza echinospora]